MGVFERTVRVSGPAQTVFREVSAVIDSGSDHCQIPEDVAEEIGARFRFQETILLSSGREIIVSIVGIIVGFDRYIVDTTAILGPPGGPVILGSIALAQMGFGIDPVEERLIHRVVRLLALTNWPRREANTFVSG